MIGQAVIGKRAGAPVFVMGVPIRDADGQVLGVLAGVTSLSDASFLDEVATSHYGKTGGYLLVDARHRQIVTATDKSRIMEYLPVTQARPALDRFIAGYEGSMVVVSSHNVEVLTSARAIPAAGWLLAAGLPTAEAFLPIAMMQQRMLWATGHADPAGRTVDGVARASQARAARVDGGHAGRSVGIRSHAVTVLPLAGDGEIRRLIGSFSTACSRRWRGARMPCATARNGLKALHDASAAGIGIHEDGIILECNAGLAQMTGIASTS